MLCSRFLLAIYFTHTINSVYMSIPISGFIPPPPPWCSYIYSLLLCLYLCFVNKIVHTSFFFFQISHKCVKIFVFLFLTNFTLYDYLYIRSQNLIALHSEIAVLYKILFVLFRLFRLNLIKCFV